MREFGATADKESEIAKPSIWSYIVGVSVSMALIIGISQFVFDLVPERSEFVETEEVANEIFKKFSHRLEAIKRESEKEMEATRRDG